MHNMRAPVVDRRFVSPARFAAVLSLAFAIAFIPLTPRVALAANEPAPPAKEILAWVRMHQAAQEVDLQGKLRQDQTVVPFRLTQTGPVVRYSFTNPDEALQLHLGEKESRLEEITRSGVEKVTPAQVDKKVRGTDVTYEDLALRFLYWDDAKVVGDDSMRTRICWKLMLHGPNRQSHYSNVALWIDKESGALMRMDGYGWDGKVSKRFEVVSGQKIDGRWFLKQMRIEALQPGSNKVQSRTYLDIERPIR